MDIPMRDRSICGKAASLSPIHRLPSGPPHPSPIPSHSIPFTSHHPCTEPASPCATKPYPPTSDTHTHAAASPLQHHQVPLSQSASSPLQQLHQEQASFCNRVSSSCSPETHSSPRAVTFVVSSQTSTVPSRRSTTSIILPTSTLTFAAPSPSIDINIEPASSESSDRLPDARFFPGRLTTFTKFSHFPTTRRTASGRFTSFSTRRNLTGMDALRRNSTAGVVYPNSRRSVSFNTSAIRRLSSTYARGSDAAPYRDRASTTTSTSSALPLYLFRAPGVQMRIGLHDTTIDSMCEAHYVGGDTITGTVLLYRDGTALSTVRDLRVYLVPEVARRKPNASYDPTQEFRPQDLNAVPRYRYTHTLVPASQKRSWTHGPHEARFHSVTHPLYHAPIAADITPSFLSNGDQNISSSLTHSFQVQIPIDAPASRTWQEDKQCRKKNHNTHGNNNSFKSNRKSAAAIDLRYRLVAVADLSQGEQSECTVVAETYVLVGNANNNINNNSNNFGTPSSSSSSYHYTTTNTTTSRRTSMSASAGYYFTTLKYGSKPLKRMRAKKKNNKKYNNAHEEENETTTLKLCTDEVVLVGDKIIVRCENTTTHKSAPVVLTERVCYMGKVRAEKRVVGVASDDSNYAFAAEGLGVSLKEGPLSVTHYVNTQRVYVVLDGHNSSIATSNNNNYYQLRKETAALRKQPCIRFYYRDELPLFSNLDYATRNTNTVIPSQRLSALTLASRLPRLNTNNNNNNHNNSNTEVCCLCLDHLHDQKVTRLSPCGHLLHLTCAQVWLRHAAAERRGAICCPMCKTVLQ